jgi:hypothetical protein
VSAHNKGYEGSKTVVSAKTEGNILLLLVYFGCNVLNIFTNHLFFKVLSYLQYQDLLLPYQKAMGHLLNCIGMHLKIRGKANGNMVYIILQVQRDYLKVTLVDH